MRNKHQKKQNGNDSADNKFRGILLNANIMNYAEFILNHYN